MSASPVVIPYEKQSDPQTNRGCGAACLSMVYRSFGKDVPQEEIWPAIAKKNRFGSIASTSHLMALDASKRGFAAVAIQARHALQVLRLCKQAGVRAILNHRPSKESSSGHYSVFVDIDDKFVILHDPFYGPSRSLPPEEVLELWRPRSLESEITGFGLIAISDQSAPSVSVCEFCRSAMPARVECPRCKQAVGLRPSVPLGCVNTACIARMWNYISCPACDYTWTFSIDAQTPASGPAADEEQKVDTQEPLSFAAAFAEMSKFTEHILSIPAAAQKPEIRKQLEALAAVKEQLVLSRAEALTHLKVQEERIAAMKESAKAGEEAHRRRMEAVNQPAPRLDGGALAQALLKNLGFTK